MEATWHAGLVSGQNSSDVSALTNTYQEIALERPHRCSGCDGSQFLSHSHLIPRSWRKDLECVKENIVYHCLDMAKGCHTKWEGMNAPLLKDFEQNMEYILTADSTYFWKKFYSLKDHWEISDDKRKNEVEIKLINVYKLAYRQR